MQDIPLVGVLRSQIGGFTIVELVIVIAVMAILTAILVPTFVNLTAKANKASDQSLVKNLRKCSKLLFAESLNRVNCLPYKYLINLVSSLL